MTSQLIQRKAKPWAFNPEYVIDFVMRLKRTKNQRVMDEKHSIAMVEDIAQTKWLIQSYFESE